MNPPAISAPLEIEAKLLVPRAADLRAIARLERLGPYRLRARDVVRLRTLYLDTPELTLARHGVALRVRRDGNRWEVTAKWAGQVNGLMHERPELTVPLATAPATPFVLPPGPLREQLTALVAGRPLRPILLTQIQRQRIDVLPADTPDASRPDDKPLAELALDRVRIAPPDRQSGVGTTYCEVEIELRHGTAGEIMWLAEQLQHDFGLTPSHESKFARGLMLLYGAALFEQHPPAPVVAGEPVETAVRKLIGEQLRRLRGYDPGVRTGTDPEALHDFRVAIRRLRAAVRLFSAGLPARLRTSIARDLKWLGDSSSSVRDIDVQLAAFARYRDLAPDDRRAALVPLAAHLQSERARLRTLLLKGLDSARYRGLLLRLERCALTPPRRPLATTGAQEPFAAAGRRALGRALRRALNRGREVAKLPSAENLHRLRIRAKRLRYLLEFLRDLTGKRGRRLVKRLIRLQDLLGAHHDAVVAAERVRAFAEAAGVGAGAPTLVALGVFMGHQHGLAEAARSNYQKVWRRFSNKQAEKDMRELRRRLTAGQTEAVQLLPAPAVSAPTEPANPTEAA